MKYVTEYIGSLLFMGAIAFIAPSGSAFTPFVIGTALMCAVYFGGHVSGAHYNPAVSLAVLMLKKIDFKQFCGYVVAQILGSLTAFFMASSITGIHPGIMPGKSTYTEQTFANWQVLLVEIFFTMFLALVVLHVAVNKKTAGNSFYGLAIGMTIAAAASAGGWISGGAFNPAVAIGLTVERAVFSEGDWQYLWLYIVGPLLGGALGATIYGIQIASDELEAAATQ